jgi:hypothetical protein
MGFCGGDFCSEHLFSMRQGVTVEAAPAALSPWFSMAQGSRLKPLLPKNGLLWGNFCSEHLFSMRQGVTMKVASATQSPWLSMTPGSRLKPLLPKNGLLWGGLLLRAPVFDEARGHGGGCSGSPEPLVVDDAEFAAEAAPTQKWASVGGLSPRTSAFDDKRIRGRRRRPRGSRGGGPVGGAREDPGEGYFSSR